MALVPHVARKQKTSPKFRFRPHDVQPALRFPVEFVVDELQVVLPEQFGEDKVYLHVCDTVYTYVHGFCQLLTR